MARIKGRLAMIPITCTENSRSPRYITRNVNSTAQAAWIPIRIRPRQTNARFDNTLKASKILNFCPFLVGG